MVKYDRYIKEVVSGKIVVNKWVRLAVERHVKDLVRKEFTFNKDSANKAIEIIESINIAPKIPFLLTDFQAFIVASIFGWKQTKSGLRRYRYSYLELARKSGKTTIAEAIALVFFISEIKAEVYNAATKFDQAKYGFDIARSLVQFTPWLSEIIVCFERNMHISERMSKFEPLTSKAKRLDGLNPLCSIIDEFHEHPDDKLYNVLKSGMGARKAPHQLTITTAGFDRFSKCYELRTVCTQILEGQLEDDSIFSIIYTIDEEDRWDDEKVWIKSNPNLGITVSYDYLYHELKQAQNMGGSQEVNFKTKNLNIWCDSAKVWIKDSTWIKNAHGIKKSYLKGKLCYIGLDLAKGIDLNACILFFPDIIPDIHALLAFFWIPEEKVKTSQDGVDYQKWIDEELIFSTPGNIVDHKFITKTILDFRESYMIDSIIFDPALAYHGTIQELADNGLVCAPISQAMPSLSEPTKEFEKLATNKQFENFSNPVLRWMLSNVEIRTDSRGYIRADKERSKNKIDGIAAAINATAQFMTKRMQSEIVFDIW